MTQHHPIVLLDNVTINYGKRCIIKDFSLSATPGQLSYFIGPNGSGKSTVMRCLLRLLPPTAGTVTEFIPPLASTSYRENIGFVPATVSKLPYLTTRSYLELSDLSPEEIEGH